MKKVVVLSLLVLTAACGGAAKPAAASVPIASLETKAAMTGCTPTTLPLTAAMATCTYGSGSITLATFTTSSNRDLWVLAQRSAVSGIIVEGPGWAICTLDGNDATSLAAALHGTTA